jgi:hypothetical protein
MSKREPNKTKRERKKVDLADRYQKIGISAVAAALRCQKEKKPDDLSAWRQQKENNSKRSTGGPTNIRLSMLTKYVGSLDEKRAYYRLLRHLLSEKLQASYKEDPARPLPPRMVDLLKTLEQRKPSETH